MKQLRNFHWDLEEFFLTFCTLPHVQTGQAEVIRMVISDRYDAEVANFLAEHTILRQLIRRNNNQHRRTGLFVVIKTLDRRIRVLIDNDAMNNIKKK